MASLYILSGAQKDEVIELTGDQVTIGRAQDNMVYLEDDSVSGYHALIIRDGDDYLLRDLNSTNETWVNGTRIVETKLNDGDKVQFGSVDARFELASITQSEPQIPTVTEVVPPSTSESVSPPDRGRARKMSVLSWVIVGISILAVLTLLGLVRLGKPRTAEVSAQRTVAPVSNVKTAVLAVAQMAPRTEEKQPKLASVKIAPETPVQSLVESQQLQVMTGASVNTQKDVTQSGASAPGAVMSPFESQATKTPLSKIDELVSGRLEKLGIQPANASSDAVFLRRAYLDVIGTLPTAQEAEEFLQNQDPDKRRALIDRLLERDEFTDYWSMKWSDLLRVKAEFPINLWPNAAQAYHRWIRTAIKENKPYDQFVREMLTASGSNFRVGQVNFYRAMQNKEPQGIAQTVVLAFMGERAEKWSIERLAGVAAFFSQVGYKSTGEWKEEIIFFDPGKATNYMWKAAMFPDGTLINLTAGRDPRSVFADWLIDPKNPWFTRNIANRVWSWLLGRGIIHEPDDIRPDNPPCNPELLAYLEQELVSSHYDLKHLYRLILNSRTYQLSSITNTKDPAGEINFACYPLRRLDAEVLIDALNQITGTTEKYSSAIPEPYTFIPEGLRSIALPDGSITSPFLEMFGRSPRDTGLESERNNRPTVDQRLYLLNSSHIQRKLEQSSKLKTLLQSKGAPREIIDGLYLTILSRFPTDEELKIVRAYFQSSTERRRAAALDLAWALINSTEFLYRH
ncbi:MAG: DUF1553 domain-containing protein [Verrucomicrobiia bacterium]